MESLPGIIQTLGVLTNFALLGTTRIGGCIRVLALQGLIIGSLPVFLRGGDLDLRVWLLVGANVLLKAVIFPWLLLRLRARTGFMREVEPFVGFVGSILFGLAALAFSIWLAGNINATLVGRQFVVLDAAIFLILTGLFLIVTRLAPGHDQEQSR